MFKLRKQRSLKLLKSKKRGSSTTKLTEEKYSKFLKRTIKSEQLYTNEVENSDNFRKSLEISNE